MGVIHPGDLDINLGPDLKLCVGDDSLLVGVSPNQGYKYKSYLWSDGTTNDTTKHKGSGWYWFQVVDVCDNVYRDSIYVEVVLLPILDLGPDTVMCYGDTLNYDISFPASNYLWENGSASPLRTIVNSGNYWAQITNFCDRISDTVNVTVLNVPNQALGPDTVFCQGDSVTFDLTSVHSTFLWDDSSTSPIRSLSLPGVYWVELSNKCGKSIDTVTIGTIDSISLELGLDSIICSGDTLTFDATSPFSVYLWEDGSTAPIREVWSGGTYFVEVQNVCNTAYDTLDLEIVDCFCDMYISNAFTPNGDGLNEVYGPKTYCKPVEYLFQIYSRWGDVLYESTDYLAKWNGVTNGRMAINDEFVYKLIFRFKHQSEPVTKIGNVTVVRKKPN
ncbi:MAG: gliding motility-associated-like protein [Candidatus Azotimanducaceae bacterium]